MFLLFSPYTLVFLYSRRLLVLFQAEWWVVNVIWWLLATTHMFLFLVPCNMVCYTMFTTVFLDTFDTNCSMFLCLCLPCCLGYLLYSMGRSSCLMFCQASMFLINLSSTCSKLKFLSLYLPCYICSFLFM